MTAPANGTPHAVLDDACRRAEMVLTDVMERADPSPDGGIEVSLNDALAVRTEINTLKSARALADARAKQADSTPDMGGATLDLTVEEMRLLREILETEAHSAELMGARPLASMLRALRKRINAGVVRNCERRCGQETVEAFQALRAAEAVTDSDETEGDAA